MTVFNDCDCCGYGFTIFENTVLVTDYFWNLRRVGSFGAFYFEKRDYETFSHIADYASHTHGVTLYALDDEDHWIGLKWVDDPFSVDNGKVTLYEIDENDTIVSSKTLVERLILNRTQDGIWSTSDFLFTRASNNSFIIAYTWYEYLSGTGIATRGIGHIRVKKLDANFNDVWTYQKDYPGPTPVASTTDAFIVGFFPRTLAVSASGKIHVAGEYYEDKDNMSGVNQKCYKPFHIQLNGSGSEDWSEIPTWTEYPSSIQLRHPIGAWYFDNDNVLTKYAHRGSGTSADNILLRGFDTSGVELYSYNESTFGSVNTAGDGFNTFEPFHNKIYMMSTSGYLEIYSGDAIDTLELSTLVGLSYNNSQIQIDAQGDALLRDSGGTLTKISKADGSVIISSSGLSSFGVFVPPGSSPLFK